VRYKNGKQNIAGYSSALPAPHRVDILGTGAAMISSSALRFDVRTWPHGNMADLGTAIEAARAGIPMFCVERRHRLVHELAVDQVDSLAVARSKDDSRQTALCNELLRLRP
jgi:hypothetical protein